MTGSLTKIWISKKGKIEEKISNFHGEESNCCRVDELAVVCSMSYKHTICLKKCFFFYIPRLALPFKIHYGIFGGFDIFLGDSLGFASSPRGFQGFSWLVHSHLPVTINPKFPPPCGRLQSKRIENHVINQYPIITLFCAKLLSMQRRQNGFLVMINVPSWLLF